MLKIAARPVLFSAALAFFGTTAAAQAAPKAAGHWEGKIHMGAQDVPMAIDLSKNAIGAWIGTFSVPGSTQVDVPLGNITADDANVHFTLSIAEVGTFEGKLSADANSIAGTATSSQGSAQFDLVRSGDAHVNLPPSSSALPKEFEGRWEGAIEAGGNRMRLAMKLAADADGKAAGTLISVDQGGQEFPATTVTIAGKKLSVEARSISGSFIGTLGEAGEIAGEWSQGGQRIPLTFKRTDGEAKKP
jgi:hypothetical protein